MKDQLLSTLEISKKYTLAAAEAMPESAYSYKPEGAGWTYGELLNHIAYGIHWWENNFITGNKIDWNPPSLNNNKKDVVSYLTKVYNRLKETITHETLNQDSVNGFHATIDHITHHRGQAVFMLRLKGINPPEYTY